MSLTLRTERLLLRDFVDEDAPHANAYESLPEVVRYLERDVFTIEQTLAHMHKVRAETAAQSPRQLFDLAIVPDAVGHVIGRAGLHIQRPSHREAAIWYLVHPAHQRQGYVTEAMRAVISYGFSTLGLHRMFADLDPRNANSVRMCERLGMKREAHLRENYWVKGEWCDAYIYGLLDRDWPGQHKSA